MPVRSVMLGVGIAVLALVAATTFGSSLDKLVDRPHLFGWAWDATLSDSAGYGNSREEVAHRVLDNDPNVDAWAGAFFGAAAVDGTNVPLLGVTPGASVHPPILEGRSIESTHEVVMGSSTLAQLGKDIGDSRDHRKRRRAGDAAHRRHRDAPDDRHRARRVHVTRRRRHGRPHARARLRALRRRDASRGRT